MSIHCVLNENEDESTQLFDIPIKLIAKNHVLTVM